MKRMTWSLFLSVLSASGLFADLLVSRGFSGVDRYSNDGVFLGNWIAAGAGGLSDAQGVTVLPNGDLLVGDFDNDNILRFAANGTFLNVFASGAVIRTPFDVVVGTGGDVFVANAGGLNTIARLDPTTGAVIAASFTSGNISPIGGPQYMAFGPTLALTDIAGRLFRFDPTTGVHISTFFFDNPEGVAYAANGDLYLAQRISNNVLRLPAGGGPAQIVIPMGSFGGEPADIAIGPNGLLYVSADAIYRFDVSGAAGVLVDSFGTGGEFLVFTSDIPESATGAMGAVALAWLAFLARRRAA